MKILVVEDSKPILTLVQEMLEKAGYDVLIARNGEQALSVLKGERVDVILLDWNMPVMSGIEFLRNNRKEEVTRAHVIMMTTESAPTKIKEALELEAREYIMKPFTSDILISKIADVISDVA